MMRILTVLGVLATAAAATAAEIRVDEPWPDGSLAGLSGEPVTFPSASPFTPAQMGEAAETTARGELYLPPGDHETGALPAVVFLHGAGGVRSSREGTYARQFVEMGVAALVVDAFGARRDMANGFIERLLEITESMMASDAYAALDYLASRPEIDADRVALIGFSYGGMASMYALHETVAERLSPNGRRFAAHVAYYGPCIARFEDVTTTGAPMFMAWGDGDELIDPERCAEIADDMRDGGSVVETAIYEGAVHQWDGGIALRPIGRLLTDCRFRVSRSGAVRDQRTLVPMSGPITRRLILAACVEDRPYMIGADDAVRERSNRDLGRFLAPILGGDGRAVSRGR